MQNLTDQHSEETFENHNNWDIVPTPGRLHRQYYYIYVDKSCR